MIDEVGQRSIMNCNLFRNVGNFFHENYPIKLIRIDKILIKNSWQFHK